MHLPSLSRGRAKSRDRATTRNLHSLHVRRKAGERHKDALTHAENFLKVARHHLTLDTEAPGWCAHEPERNQ